MRKFIILLSFLLICGCSANPMTDEQIKIVAEQCEKSGGTIRIFNSIAVSRCECVFNE